MAGNVALVMDILARDKASKTLSTVGTTADTTGKKLHGVGTTAKVGMVAAAGALAGFGKQSNDTFQRVGKETLMLQRSIGGTAEEASRLRFAAQETGTDIDVFTKSMGLLSKNLVGATDKTKLVTTHVEVATGAWRKQTTIIKDAAGHFQTVTKMVPVMKMESLSRAVRVTNPLIKQLGISVRDSTGHIRPMNDLLPEIAEKFKNMPNGAEKTALALKLFGRSGTAMLPFLNRGAEGIKDLQKESDKLGNTLSGKDLQAVKDNTKAKREWHAAVQGVQIQLGRNLFPILTKGALVLAKVASFVERNGAVMKPLIVGVAALAAGIKVWTIAQAALNFVMEANPIGLIVVGIAALTAGLIYAYKHSETFRNIVQTTFSAVAVAIDFVKDHWQVFATAFALLLGGPVIGAIVLLVTHFGIVKQVAETVFGAVTGAVSAVYNWITAHWPLLLGILTGPIGLAVYAIVRYRDQIWGAIKALPGLIASGLAGLASILTAPFRAGVTLASAQLSSIVSSVKAMPKRIASAASGMFDGIKNAFRSAINWIIGKWNDLSFGIDIPNKVFGVPVPGGGGHVGIDTPNITPFAKGGIVTAPTLGLIGEAGPEAVIPLSRGLSRSGGGDVVINFNGVVTDPIATGREIERVLTRLRRERGTALGFA